MHIRFNGDQTLIRVDGVKTQIKGGEVVYVDDGYGEELLRNYSNVFIEVPAPEEKKTVKRSTQKLTNYSKGKK